MAKPLDEWPTLEREQRFPWSEWLDGRPWQLTRGEDYDSRAKTIIANARSQAKKRGGTVRTRTLNEGTEREAVVVQFRADA
jgi:hypothetical protein